jgi:hypothetical protein
MSGKWAANRALPLSIACLMAAIDATILAQSPPAPTPQAPQSAQSQRPAIETEIFTRSKVFPDGGFPEFPPVPEGAFPTVPSKPAIGFTDPSLHPADSDYGPGGYPARDVQDGPGVPEFYIPRSDPLPPYYYRPEYYEQLIGGPKTVIWYAPPGYEARDQQYGPATPEFIFLTPPAPVSPEERQKFVVRGVVPGSFLVPGTNTSFRFRGFVRLMGLYDFDPIGSRDSFVPNTIPVPQTQGQNWNYGARYSRIAIESWTPTAFKEWTLHTFVEGDFFNGPAQAVGGGGNPFRLRHAFIDFGYFRVGQQNTVFMDATSWPNVVDFQGPAGWANQRRPGARMTIPLADKLFWAAGCEQPFSDISTNGLGTNVQDVPDFATHLRYEADNGHVQVSALMRSVGYEPADGEVTRRFGYGISAATTFHPWAILCGVNTVHKNNPTALERCRLIGQYTCGRGIGRYLQDTAGLGLDGQVDPQSGNFELPYVSGCVVSYEHWYNEQWLSAITWSRVLAASTSGQPGDTYTGATYLTANLWFIPIRNLSLGVECIYGQRGNLNEERGHATRLNGLVQYNF